MTNKNQLFYGDNLEVLRKHIKDESVDLCYIDPPFNSKRNYNQIYNNVGKEDRAQAQAFIDTWTWDDFANQGLAEILENYQGKFTSQSIDLIAGLTKVLGKGSLLAYLISMTLRVVEIYRVLKPTGSFYLHCDATASHYLKLVLDAVFCPQGGDFRNEIIWCYRGGGAPKKDFGRRHDVIFRYSKSDGYRFNADAIRIAYQAEGIGRKDDAMWGKHKGTNKVYKPHPLGKIPEDWWPINILNANDPERLGYPTQKPEALLERIIKASSNEGDTILDAYCGCGTTVAVAQKLDRHWIGIDITYQSISLILKRLEDAFGKGVLEQIELNGIPKDMESALALANKKDDRTRKEFEKWAILTYSNNRAIINQKKGADKGIDGVAFFQGEKGEPAKIILQVKSGNIKSGDLRDLQGTMTLEGAELGIFITLKEPTNAMLTTAKKAGIYQSKLYRGESFEKIKIVTIREILEEQKRLDVRLGFEVLKSAEKKKEVGGKQLNLLNIEEE
jgi:site-specific DNA-methyltransferase (adenine-specific)